ncbi:hypothetical protein GQF03_17450 [Sneathiella chungangensis]|uniref:Uncharacterized protein n=1 Tax=Sneathiella chungangensis TaxID=1418234 RepID=A0A845MJ78_9PROT|nr:hypothetical protein [Sneathiella chungangensis]MZR24123.1 hypothetical protein [Sneathiella chungangensis]
MKPTPFVDKDGNYLGIFNSAPEGGIPVDTAPAHAGQKWNNGWGDIPERPQEEQDKDALADTEAQATILVELYKGLVREGGPIDPASVDVKASASFQKLKTAIDRRKA